MVVHQENATLPINAPVGTEDQVVRGMMGVGRAESLQDRIPEIGLVVSIGVLQEKQIRTRRHQHTVVPELKAERVVDMREDLANVGRTVAVGVFKDHQAVVHLLTRLPLGIGIPAGYPEPSLGIHLHLHRVGQIWKLHF